MAKRKHPYQVGDWFSVPLPGGGYGLGLIARKGRGGIVLGYFFGPRRASLPGEDEVRHLRDCDAVVVWRFGDLGLLEQQWPIIGRLPGWRQEDWPVPTFGRIDILGNAAWRVHYVEPDLLTSIDEPTTVEVASGLPRDGLLGAIAVENALDALLPAEVARTAGGELADACTTTESAARVSPASSGVSDGQLYPVGHTNSSVTDVAHDDSDEEGSQHAIQIFLQLSNNGLGSDSDWHIFERLEDHLNEIVSQRAVGEFDGNEIGNGYWCLVLYGPSADKLADVVLSTLKDWPIPIGSYLLKRYGDPGAKTDRIELS